MLTSSLGAIAILWEPSANHQILYFSYYRFAAIVAMAVLSLYLLASFRSPGLTGFNNTVAYTVAFGLIGLEIVLRIFPAFISDDMLAFLPGQARQRIAAERGLFTETNMRGDGLLFVRKPGAHLKHDAQVAINQAGFRNDRELGKGADVAVIGASIFDGAGAGPNLAELFRAAGVDAYNLSMPAWGPGQYRDAYRKYFARPRLANRVALIGIYLPRDLARSVSYMNSKKTGGDWRSDLGMPEIAHLPIPDRYYPWTLSILGKLPHLLASRWGESAGAPATANTALSGQASGQPPDALTIRLPYGEFNFPASKAAIANMENAWPDFAATIVELSRMVIANGAKPVFVLSPDIAVLTLPYADGDWPIKKRWQDYHLLLKNRLQKAVTAGGGELFDLTPIYRREIRKAPITGAVYDGHLNPNGTRIMARALLPLVD